MRVAQNGRNMFQDSINICEYFMVPKSDDPIALILQERCPSLVGLYLYGMLPAVKFDYEPSFWTTGIYNKGRNNVLAAKFSAVDLPAAQVSPQIWLGFCQITA